MNKDDCPYCWSTVEDCRLMGTNTRPDGSPWRCCVECEDDARFGPVHQGDRVGIEERRER